MLSAWSIDWQTNCRNDDDNGEGVFQINHCTFFFYDYQQIPTPDMIRPKPVLEKWLEILHDRMAKKAITYEYYSSQLRAIRQDLTVVMFTGMHSRCSISKTSSRCTPMKNTHALLCAMYGFVIACYVG